ncbi:MAG: NAD(P)-dependent alcohol dehydrogenase [Clostridia bacterium]|nr:NAD(P)-dependent alcohol dehydrogenase [Clostridia bacterium]
MKAAVLEDIGKIVIKDIEKPVPGPGEVLIKIEYVGICGSDVHYYEHGRIGDFIVDEPLILGHECSGVVVGMGAEVTGFSAGDRVVPEPGFACNKCEYCKSGRYNLCDRMSFMATPPIDGALCEYIVYPADMTFRLPENISLMEGALIEPLAIGIYAAQRGKVFPGARVLVQGAGCIGLVTMLACKAHGASEVIVTDVISNRLEAALNLGADKTINSLNEKSDDSSVDIAIDCVGIEQTVNGSIDAVKKGGIIVLVGMGGEGRIPVNLNRAIGKEIDFASIFRYRNIFPTALKMVSDGKIEISGIVSHSFDFKDIEKAMEFVMNNKQNVVKAVIKV